MVADIVREAHIYASQKNAKYVTAEQVDQAIEARIYRSNLVQEKLREFIQKNFIFISTDGTAVGQINGLSVLSVGDFSFGAPSRITVAVGLGKEGLIDVQREVNMSGPIHGKGVMIIAGFLASRFAKDKPLTLARELSSNKTTKALKETARLAQNSTPSYQHYQEHQLSRTSR